MSYRDFNSRNQEPYRPSFGGFSFFPPVIKNLLIWNVAIYFLQLIFSSGFHVGKLTLDDWMQQTFALIPIGEGFRVWQVITYMFLHGDLMHLVFNMFALWMFGMEIEHIWGSQRFILFYFACGIGAALANLFVAPLFTSTAPTIGASGGVYGVLVAFAMLFPDRMVIIFPLPIPIKAKYLVGFYILLEIWNGVTASGSGVAHMAHLGGALVGAIWVLLEGRGVLDQLHDKIKSSGSSDALKGAWKDKAKEATFYDINSTSTTGGTGFTTRNSHQEIIDRILDKISKSGYENLTEEEKKILFEESKKLN